MADLSVHRVLRRRFVLVSPEMGIYLGNCLGLGFWSKLDPVGQPSAVTFESDADAIGHAQSWDGGVPEGLTSREVEADDGIYASVAACVAAGLEGWSVS